MIEHHAVPQLGTGNNTYVSPTPSLLWCLAVHARSHVCHASRFVARVVHRRRRGAVTVHHNRGRRFRQPDAMPKVVPLSCFAMKRHRRAAAGRTMLSAMTEEFEGPDVVARRMHLVLPNGRNKELWDWFVLTLVLYNALVVPFGLSFYDFTDFNVSTGGGVFDAVWCSRHTRARDVTPSHQHHAELQQDQLDQHCAI